MYQIHERDLGAVPEGWEGEGVRLGVLVAPSPARLRHRRQRLPAHEQPHLGEPKEEPVHSGESVSKEGEKRNETTLLTPPLWKGGTVFSDEGGRKDQGLTRIEWPRGLKTRGWRKERRSSRWEK